MPTGLTGGDIQALTACGVIITAAISLSGIRNTAYISQAKRADDLAKQVSDLQKVNQVLAEEKAKAIVEAQQKANEAERLAHIAADAEKEKEHLRAECDKLYQRASDERTRADAAIRSSESCQQECARAVAAEGLAHAKLEVTERRLQDALDNLAEYVEIAHNVAHVVDASVVEEAAKRIKGDAPP